MSGPEGDAYAPEGDAYAPEGGTFTRKVAHSPERRHIQES